MILKDFKTGWQEAFEKRIQALVRVFPNVKLTNINRYHGMLRISFQALDNSEDTQYILDCVTHKIERDSARICENCGGYGIRRDSYLQEKMCLCWKCYALEVDALDPLTHDSYIEKR